jgi:hypothetical protein
VQSAVEVDPRPGVVKPLGQGEQATPPVLGLKNPCSHGVGSQVPLAGQ